MRKWFEGSSRLAEFLIYLVIIISYIELGVWIAYSKGLFKNLSAYTYMTPATSIIIVLLSTGILFWYHRNKSRIYQYCFTVIMSVVYAYALLILINHTFSNSISEIARIYNPEKQLAKVLFFELSPLMAAMSILTLLSLQIGFFLKESFLKRNIDMFISITIFSLCYFVGLGYISGVPLFYVTNVIPVGLPGVLMFILIIIAIQLFQGKNSWLYKIFLDTFKVKTVESGNLSRNLFLYFAILVLVMSFAGSIFVRVSYNNIRSDAVNNLKTVNSYVSRQISNWYRKQVSEGISLGSNKNLRNSALAVITHSADAKAINDIKQWMDYRIKNYQYIDISLYNNKGFRLLTSSKSEPPPDYKSDLLFESIIRKNTIHISEINSIPAKSEKLKTILNIWVPLNSDNTVKGKESAGLWLIRIDPETELYSIANQCRFFIKHSESIIFSHEDDLVAVLNQSQQQYNLDVQRWINSKVYDDLFNAKGIAKVNSIYEGLDYKDKPVLLSISPIIQTSWFLLVKVDNKEVFRSLKFNIIIALSFITALIMLLSVIVSLIERNKDKYWYMQQVELEKGRKLAEEALQNVELSYRNILDNLMEGCQIVDSEKRYVYVNNAFTTQNDKLKRNVIGKTIEEVFPGTESTKLQVAIAKCIDKQTPQVLEYRTKLKDGSIGWIISKCQPVGDRVLIVSSDITQRKLAEIQIKKLNDELEQKIEERTQQLQQALNEMESFSYSVSHDLRAPLRSITSFSEVLESSYKSQLDEKGQDFLTRICNAAKRMNALIDDILKLSRISRTPMKMQDIDLRTLIDKVLALTIPADTTRKSHFELDIEGSIEGDESLLIIALNNIIDNAWKFTSYREETRIKIFTAMVDNSLNLVIVDNGAGFDMKFAGNLFAPFQRLHKMEEFHGTGIGLTIVQRIMQKHNGSVSIQSIKDAGTTINLIFNLKGEENDRQDDSTD